MYAYTVGHVWRLLSLSVMIAVRVSTCMHTVGRVWRLETTLEIRFLLLLLCGFWEWNLGHRLVW